MSEYLTVLKDILLLLSPIIVAYISYRSNKKSKREIQQEIDKSLKEKDAETSQILKKISAELESQKQLAVWNSSLPQTDEYTKLTGAERYGNVCAISGLVSNIRGEIDSNGFTVEDLLELKKLLEKVKLPSEDQELYPYEIPHIIAYKKLVRDIDSLLGSNKESSV